MLVRQVVWLACCRSFERQYSATLYSIRSAILSQWIRTSTGVMCSDCLVPVTSAFRRQLKTFLFHVSYLDL